MDGDVDVCTDPDSPDAQKSTTDFTLVNAEGFAPFVLHEPHAPVPIAMVNRAPHGSECLSPLFPVYSVYAKSGVVS